MSGHLTKLTFGTAGLRAVVGPAPDQLNEEAIRVATQGLANSLNGTKRVVIGYDSRLSSPSFAQETARVLLGNGIETYLCDRPMPTPFISFACRELGCGAAVMITASHNPPEYNGYKVYWADGAQVVPPNDAHIMDCVKQVRDVKTSDQDPQIVPETVIESYLDAVANLQLVPQDGSGLKIVYTPLHGVGGELMHRALKRWGYQASDVPTQMAPDGHFPEVTSPNPENPEALKVGMQQLALEGADLLLATDPDADRLGAVVMHENAPRFLTGNEIAILLTDHILTHFHLPQNGAVVSSIVTTPMLKFLAKAHGVTQIDVLTGFKYIGELIHIWESTHEHTFVFGAEESHGYLFGTHSRDKDAIVSGCLVAEMALCAKKAGLTLIDRLNHLYETYGYHTSGVSNLQNVSASALDPLRANPPTAIGDYQVLKIEDLLPQANVIIYHLDRDAKVVLRPSGTEPKLKIYAMAREDTIPTLLKASKGML